MRSRLMYQRPFYASPSAIANIHLLTFFSAKAKPLFRSSLLISPSAVGRPVEPHSQGILEPQSGRTET